MKPSARYRERRLPHGRCAVCRVGCQQRPFEDQGSIPAMRSAALATTGSEYVIEAPVPKSAVAAMTVDSSFPQWFPSCDDAAINLHCP